MSSGVLGKTVVAIFALCAAWGLAQPATVESTITVALNADARTLDPVSVSETTTAILLRSLYSNLFEWGEGDQVGVMVPYLASSYEWDGDLTWVVNLREDVTFHNGEPFNADSVKATFDYVMDPANGAVTGSRIEHIVEVNILSEFVVSFVTSVPYPTMLQSLSLIQIAPASLVSKNGMASLSTDPVGTGPYQFVSWDRESQIVLEKFPDYFAGEPQIDRVVFRVIPDINSRVAALLAGEVDLIYDLPPQMIPVVESNARTEVRAAQPGRRMMFVGLDNVNPGPLQDVRVRQAINYAVDVDLLVDTIMEGFATRVPSALLPQNQHFDPMLSPYPFDQDRAKELLAEAGYEGGLALTLHTPQGRYLKDVEFAQAIAVQLAEVGIVVDLRVHEWGEFLERLGTQQLSDMYVNGRPDLDLDGSILSNYLRSGLPFVSFTDPSLDAALDEALTITVPEERAAAYRQLQADIQEVAPWLFLWAQHDLYGVSRRVDWQPRDDGRIFLNTASIRE